MNKYYNLKYILEGMGSSPGMDFYPILFILIMKID